MTGVIHIRLLRLFFLRVGEDDFFLVSLDRKLFLSDSEELVTSLGIERSETEDANDAKSNVPDPSVV